MANVVQLQKEEEFASILTARTGLVVAHFWMPWSQPSVDVKEALGELAKDSENATFVNIEAENFPSICMKHSVSAVPTTVFLRNGSKVDRVDGAHVPEVTKKTAKHSSVSSLPPMPPPAKVDISSRLKQLTHSAPCILFMKGSPLEPKCGFSRQMIDILNEAKVQFSTFDILSDPEVREGLKKFSDWPTYPQLYANGELLGGLDILKELIASNEFHTMVPRQQPIEERLKELTNRSPVLLFMKGGPEEPRCGFSRQVVAILNETGVKYDTFDILTDEEVRQGLKTYSNWPSYPQLYVKGDLIGGLDIIKELKESDELRETLTATS
nr:glutaredoxin 3 [Halisarca dujardinii]